MQQKYLLNNNGEHDLRSMEACLQTGLLAAFGAMWPGASMAIGCISGVIGTIVQSLCTFASNYLAGVPSQIMSSCDIFNALVACAAGAFAGAALGDAEFESIQVLIKQGIQEFVSEANGVIALMGVATSISSTAGCAFVS